MMSDYKYRNQLLKKMGFQNYRYYLSSHLWKKEIRPRVLEKYKSKCILCKKKCTKPDVHHLQYNDAILSGESLDGMIVLCRRCHKKSEFNKPYSDKKEKRSLEQVNSYIADMIIKRGN